MIYNQIVFLFLKKLIFNLKKIGNINVFDLFGANRFKCINLKTNL